jgi:hypothetical protein
MSPSVVPDFVLGPIEKNQDLIEHESGFLQIKKQYNFKLPPNAEMRFHSSHVVPKRARIVLIPEAESDILTATTEASIGKHFDKNIRQPRQVLDIMA